MRKIDASQEIERISRFLRDYLRSSGFKSYVVGMSGGVDSALSAALAVKAVGKENVIAVMMPYEKSHPDSLIDGELICQHLGIKSLVVDISPMVNAYFSRYEPDAEHLRKGNLIARTRMCVLYDLSAKYRALVLGTSNQSELMTGYFTQFGDSAAAIEPLGQLFKTEVWQLSRALGLPSKIVDKIPTADLWPEQSDEEDMGITYQDLDEIIWGIKNMDDLHGFDDKKVKRVYTLIARSAFKRNPAPMPEAPCSL